MVTLSFNDSAFQRWVFNLTVQKRGVFPILTVACVMKVRTRDFNSIWSLSVTVIKQTCVIIKRCDRKIKQVCSKLCFPYKGLQFILRKNIVIVKLPLGFLILVFRRFIEIIFCGGRSCVVYVFY